MGRILFSGEILIPLKLLQVNLHGYFSEDFILMTFFILVSGRIVFQKVNVGAWAMHECGVVSEITDA